MVATDFGRVLSREMIDQEACGNALKSALGQIHHWWGLYRSLVQKARSNFRCDQLQDQTFILLMGIRLYLKWFPCLFFSLVKASSGELIRTGWCAIRSSCASLLFCVFVLIWQEGSLDSSTLLASTSSFQAGPAAGHMLMSRRSAHYAKYLGWAYIHSFALFSVWSMPSVCSLICAQLSKCLQLGVTVPSWGR